jgi:cytochrome P450
VILTIPSRSPTWSDFNDIPYVNAIVKEGMRWRPVYVSLFPRHSSHLTQPPSISSGLPHKVKEDDYYEGMLIPKDSTIFIPIWALNNSETQGFTEPETYNPDRYIDFPRLANDYAGSPDYNARDKSPLPLHTRMIPG